MKTYLSRECINVTDPLNKLMVKKLAPLLNHHMNSTLRLDDQLGQENGGRHICIAELEVAQQGGQSAFHLEHGKLLTNAITGTCKE